MYSTNDTDALEKIEGIEVRTLDVERLVGGGIIHTKLWLVDGQHIYLGSANMDWRSFTEVYFLQFVVLPKCEGKQNLKDAVQSFSWALVKILFGFFLFNLHITPDFYNSTH